MTLRTTKSSNVFAAKEQYYKVNTSPIYKWNLTRCLWKQQIVVLKIFSYFSTGGNAFLKNVKRKKRTYFLLVNFVFFTLPLLSCSESNRKTSHVLYSSHYCEICQ